MKCTNCNEEFSIKLDRCPYCKQEVITYVVKEEQFVNRGRVRNNWVKEMIDRPYLNALLASSFAIVLYKSADLFYVWSNPFSLVPFIVVLYTLIYFVIPWLYSDAIILTMAYIYEVKYGTEIFDWKEKKIQIACFAILPFYVNAVYMILSFALIIVFLIVKLVYRTTRK